MKTVSATFTIENNQEAPLLAALKDMLEAVKAQEPGTYLYLASTEHPRVGPSLLTTTEVYADDSAFKKHTAPHSPWDKFRLEAIAGGWLVTAPITAKKPTGLKVVFTVLTLQASLMRSTLA